MAEDERHYDLEPHEEADESDLLRDTADTCPHCGVALASGEVLCLKCGYDLEANVIRKPKVGEEEIEEPEEHDTFVVPGRGGARLWAVVGCAVTIAAMVTAGINAEAEGWRVVAAILLPLYEVALHTASGVLAVFIVARILEERFGNAELAAARVMVAFALFQLALHLRIPVPPIGSTIAFVLGLGAYWVAVWFLFRKTPAVTLLIMAAHIVLWAFVRMGGALYAAASPVS